MSRALVDLAERGVRAEAEAKQQLKTAYRNFAQEAEPERKNEAGREADPRNLWEGFRCRRFSFLIFRAASGITCSNASMNAG